MSVNYFVNNARISCKELMTFESWIIWQLFNGNNFTDPKTAKLGYTSELKNAIVWAKNDSKLRKMFSGQQQHINSLNSTKLAKAYETAIDLYDEIIVQPEPHINIKVQGNIIATANNLDQVISNISNEMEYAAALKTFRTTIHELLKDTTTINPIWPIASGILDTSGIDNIWPRMIASNDAVCCFGDIPEEYTSVKFHETIDTMCQELLDRCKSAKKNGNRIALIHPVAFPDVDWKSVDEQLQVHAAFEVLSGLRRIWGIPKRHVADYNKRTYIMEIISRFFPCLEDEAELVWANLRYLDRNRPDMRGIMSLARSARSKVTPDILFLTCSRPSADASAFIWDWVTLVRMSKDAHDLIRKTIEDRLRNIKGGEVILEKLCTVPIILVQVYCYEIRFAILDRPHGQYYRVRVLESFELPLRPPDDVETLKAFVYFWLRLRSYVNHVVNLLQDIWQEVDELERTQSGNDYYVSQK